MSTQSSVILGAMTTRQGTRGPGFCQILVGMMDAGTHGRVPSRGNGRPGGYMYMQT